VKRLLAPRLLARLETLGAAVDDIAAPRWALHLKRVIRILEETTVGEDRLTIALECERRFVSAPTDPVALVWLQGIFRFDMERGAHVLEDVLAASDASDRLTLAGNSLAALFSDYRGEVPDIIDPTRRSATLCRLVRCAYTYVRPADDQKHEGSYTPDARDHAESARMFLMTALQETPGLSTYRALLKLAEDPLFTGISDRLRLAARQRAAQDAEFSQLTPADVVALEHQLEVPPHDRDGLYAVMTDRLDDLAHDLAHDDFTDRRTLRTIEYEAEMQLTLAGRIRDRARGAYTVTREDEVADRKKPDIRLATVRGEQRAAIEVKIADRWTIADLELALRNQLVGQYLRHDSCRVGCLLLTYHGKKGRWLHSESRRHLKFDDVIDQLSRIADAIEKEQEYRVRLLVQGLNLTDPELLPAHRP
jgi:hypothetical protein